MKLPSMEFDRKNKKRSLFALISLILLFMFGVSIFLLIRSLGSTDQSPGKVGRESRNLISVSSSSSPMMHAVKEETPSVDSIPELKLQTPSPEKSAAGAGDSMNFAYVPPFKHPVRHRQQQMGPVLKEENSRVDPEPHLRISRKPHSLPPEKSPLGNKKLLAALASSHRRRGEDFPARLKEFFSKKNESSSCKVRFFMTWFAPLSTFTQREFHSIESVFKTHPNGCLVIVSNSMDSAKGRQILKPFSDKGFRVMAISPDFGYLFKNTMADSWFSRLTRGHVHPGYAPLGQNLSNLVRLCLLHKFGGVYLDTDVIVLKSFSKLKNSIGAQAVDSDLKTWSRLNNAVMVFDKMHPLVFKFIEEFVLTFDGNNWGHNGPYLVSRVVSRVRGRPGYHFTVLPPVAFYPVNWDKVRILFRGAINETDSRLLKGKLEQIRNQSYTVLLWNKQSRGIRIEEGSILRKILSEHCLFCNSSSNGHVSKIG